MIVQKRTTPKVLLPFLAGLFVLPVCATGNMGAANATPEEEGASDIVARVGDQPITFNDINTALNSSAVVGVSIPALGSPQRDTARIILLDKFVSANLIYLDALSLGVDKDPQYEKAISRFSDAILAGLYRQRIEAGGIEVSDAEVQTYFNENMSSAIELTDELRVQIAAMLRREKVHERLADAQKHLRDDVALVVHPENIAPTGEEARPEDAPVAKVGAEIISWGEIGDKIVAAGKGSTLADHLAFEEQARREALEREVDLRIMVQKARAEGLDQDPLYKSRIGEYRKTLLTNLHRGRLLKDMEPTEQELKAWYEANRGRLVVPEARKLHMVVVETRKEADALKGEIESGEMTMYRAARDYSIAANAKQDLGEVGWVYQGDMTPPLDEAIFALGPGQVGGPIESPAGWHLIKVTDVKEAEHTDFGDDKTRALARRKYLDEKLDAYTRGLRENNRFAVEVFEDRLVELAQREADMIKTLEQKAQQPGSVTQTRIGELQRLMKSTH